MSTLQSKNEKETRPKNYQLWTDYGSEGWKLKEFETFTDCVVYLQENNSGFKTMITKLANDENYYR